MLADVVMALMTNLPKKEDIKDEFEHQFARFKMWAGNIGAHRKGQGSLDFRLRDASHISQAVLGMLRRLKEMLSESA